MNGTLQSAAQTFWRGMLGLILPRGCAGCDKPDEILCSDCQSLFRRHTVLPLNGTPSGASDGTPGAATAPNALNGIPSAAIQQPACAMIYAAGTYQGHVRRAILSWKDHGDTECDKAFSQVCRQLVAGSGIIETLQTKPQTLSQPMPQTEHQTGSQTQILVVPAPSSPKSMRTRGRRHLWPLAKATAAELAAAGVEACAVNALRTRHVQGKAVETRSALGRAARLDGQLEVNDPGLIAGKKVLILDDIVTTGTTMRRCAEAIRGARGSVAGGLALAAVPPPAER